MKQVFSLPFLRFFFSALCVLSSACSEDSTNPSTPPSAGSTTPSTTVSETSTQQPETTTRPDASEDGGEGDVFIEDTTEHDVADDVDDPDAPSEDVSLDGSEVTSPTENSVFYVGEQGAQRFYDSIRLSDGTLIVTGSSQGLSWIREDVPRIELSAANINSSSEGNTAFLLHISADFQELLHVVHFPTGSVRDIFRIRSTEVPGEPTGTLYISTTRDVSDYREDGYAIARLEGNFIDAPITSVAWSYDVISRPRRKSGFEGESAYKKLQPWDVDAQGRVVYGYGAEYDFDWAAIGRLSAEGTRDIVNNWPAHWASEGAPRGEYYQPAHTWEFSQDFPLLYSQIVLKSGRRGSLRSQTHDDYNAQVPDGNGGFNQGRFPDDVFFSGPCPAEGDCPSGPGYTGYRTSDAPTQRLGSIVIDRRTGSMFFGTSTQSVLPGGNPDFEPAVYAMDTEGTLLWWVRLYKETQDNSPPDQYVDRLAFDYANNQLVVLARAHGNAYDNFWAGDELTANSEAVGFQNRFTGTSGNIHISWLGKLRPTTGETLHATWLAEQPEGATNSSDFPEDHPLLAGQPNPNSGWPDVNTTRCQDLSVDLQGHIYVLCQGRRTLTTSNAFQAMPSRSTGAVGTWNRFMRVYTPNLSDVLYSTLLTGDWNTETGQGGDNTDLTSVLPLDGSALVLGFHTIDAETNTPKGLPIPTTTPPVWGHSNAPVDQDAIFGVLLLSE